MTETVACGCCGKVILDTPEHNVDYERRGHDTGFGECLDCAEWGFELVMRPIFDKVRSALNEKNRAMWDSTDDTKRATIVQGLLDKGALEWRIGS